MTVTCVCLVTNYNNIFYYTIGERHILSLKVKCDNTPNGCEWIGELRSLENHLTNCGFSLLPCPNECKKDNETVKLLRKDIEGHKKKKCPRRQYKCYHCRESGEYQERTTTHLEECPKKKIRCPNIGCGEEIERCDISQHHQECLFESVSCKYIKIGCKRNFLRKNVEEHHNDSQEHLQLAIDTVNNQEATIKTLEDKAAQQLSTPINFKITNFSKLKMSSKGFYSPAFYTSPGGYKMCICAYANGNGNGEGTHVSVFACLMRGENDDHLPWPFTGTVTVELLNQLKDDNHLSDQITFPPDDQTSKRVVNKEQASNGLGRPRYIPHSDLGYVYNLATRCQYLKDDCLYFRVKVDAESTSKPWLV